MKDIRSFSNPVPAGPAFSAVFSSASRSYISSAGLTLPALFGWGGGPPAGNGLFPFASAVPAFRRPSLVLQIGSSGCPARFPGPPVPPAGLASICRFCLPGSAARARFEALPRNPAHVILPCKTARLPNFPLPSGWGRIPAPTASLPYTIAAVGGGSLFPGVRLRFSPHGSAALHRRWNLRLVLRSHGLFRPLQAAFVLPAALALPENLRFGVSSPRPQCFRTALRPGFPAASTTPPGFSLRAPPRPLRAVRLVHQAAVSL